MASFTYANGVLTPRTPPRFVPLVHREPTDWQLAAHAHPGDWDATEQALDAIPRRPMTCQRCKR
jgi:hypothetical protein